MKFLKLLALGFRTSHFQPQSWKQYMYRLFIKSMWCWCCGAFVKILVFTIKNISSSRKYNVDHNMKYWVWSYTNIGGRETLWNCLLINSHDCRTAHFGKWEASKFLAILPLIRILSCTMVKCTVYKWSLYFMLLCRCFGTWLKFFAYSCTLRVRVVSSGYVSRIIV